MLEVVLNTVKGTLPALNGQNTLLLDQIVEHLFGDSKFWNLELKTQDVLVPYSLQGGRI